MLHPVESGVQPAAFQGGEDGRTKVSRQQDVLDAMRKKVVRDHDQAGFATVQKVHLPGVQCGRGDRPIPIGVEFPAHELDVLYKRISFMTCSSTYHAISNELILFHFKWD